MEIQFLLLEKCQRNAMKRNKLTSHASLATEAYCSYEIEVRVFGIKSMFNTAVHLPFYDIDHDPVLFRCIQT